MVKNNKFFVSQLEKVVFIGFSKVMNELFDINKLFNLESFVISSSDQAKGIKIEHKSFDTVDDKLYSYIENNFDIKKTLFISLGSRLIFKLKFINFLKGNLINFHGTRLPYDSGGGGFSWQIMRNDIINNQLVHLVDEGIDTGPIISYKTSIFSSSCKIPLDFEENAQANFLQFYKQFIINVKKNTKFELKHQVDYLGRYNPRLSSEHNSYINWSWDANELYNFINAFDEPYLGSTTYLNRGKFGKLHIKSAHLHGGDSSNHPFMAGIVSRHDRDWIVVCTSTKHVLLIEKIIDSKGENILSQIKVGDRFYTPNEKLENSLSKRIIYTSKGLK